MNWIQTTTAISELLESADHTAGGTFVLHFTKGVLQLTPTKHLPPDAAKICSITASEVQHGLTPNAWSYVATKTMKTIEELSK